MALLVVPGPDPEPWPTLGAGVCDLIEESAVYGPGSLQGQPYQIDPEFRAFIHRAFEVYPRRVTRAFVDGKTPGLIVNNPHPWAGRRRFKRVGLSVRKGLAKTEKEALLAYVELHPDGPTRCDGFDAAGRPVGRPVRAPYIPMLAVSVEQVEELAFGALTYICTEGADADLFDVTQDRIVRLDDWGREDGKAVPLANSPGSRDGARTTLNCFDEPHRLYMPRQLKAHETMAANLPKRPLDDPWSLYVGTAGQPGQGSVAEQLHKEAELIAAGRIERPDLFYLYRTDDDPKRDLSDKAERVKAIAEATGPAGEWGPGQFDDIASQWDRPGADKAYLERVWLNRWRRSSSQFFDPAKIAAAAARGQGRTIPAGAFVALGFDGARFRDATALSAVDIQTGLAELLAMWERPELDEGEDEGDGWEVPEAEVTAAVEDAFERFEVWRLNADPPHWTETVGSWSARWPDQVFEYWTNKPVRMAYDHRKLLEAFDVGSIALGGEDAGRVDFLPHADLVRHLHNAGTKELRVKDDQGQPLYVMAKQDGRAELKFDAGMSLSLAWLGAMDARKAGAKPRRRNRRAPRRIY